MSKPLKALGLLIGLGVAGGLATFLGGTRHRAAAPAPGNGPCAVPAGLGRHGAAVTWNPISAPGRCAPIATKLIVDNGTDRTIQVALGATSLDVKSQEQLAITTVPGRFDLRTKIDGAVLDEATLELAGSHTYVYNPDAAYDYAVRTRTYGSAYGRIGGQERVLAAAVVFDPGPIDFVLEPLPDQIQIEGDPTGAQFQTIEKTGLDHVRARSGPAARHGDLRFITIAPDHALVLSSHPALGAGLASIYVDNPEPRAALPVTLDGAELAAVPAGGYLRIELDAGHHEVAAQAAKASDRASLDVKAGERWVWSPGGRREYRIERLEYGMGLAGEPARPITARALPAFRVSTDFVFDPPAQVKGTILDVQIVKTVLRRGRVGDFHAAIVREVGALQAHAKPPLDPRWGHPDPATASECDRWAAEGQLARRKNPTIVPQPEQDAARWDCALPKP